MSVQDSINKWGIKKINSPYGTPRPLDEQVPETANITLEENIPSAYYCETCGPDPYTTTITAHDDEGNLLASTSVYMSMGEVLQEMLEMY